MVDIVTLTPNPAIDLSTSVERMVPSRKLRCGASSAIPAAAVSTSRGWSSGSAADVEAIFPAGGFTGKLLRRLLVDEGIPSRSSKPRPRPARISPSPRPRPASSIASCSRACRCANPNGAACSTFSPRPHPAPKIVVGSGSLPPGVPVDFYAQAAAVAKRLGAQFFLDTSGAPLRAALAARRHADQAEFARDAGTRRPAARQRQGVGDAARGAYRRPARSRSWRCRSAISARCW